MTLFTEIDDCEEVGLNTAYVPIGMKTDLSELIVYEEDGSGRCRRVYYERFVLDNAARDIVLLPVSSIFANYPVGGPLMETAYARRQGDCGRYLDPNTFTGGIERGIVARQRGKIEKFNN